MGFTVDSHFAYVIRCFFFRLPVSHVDFCLALFSELVLDFSVYFSFLPSLSLSLCLSLSQKQVAGPRCVKRPAA